MSQSTFNRPESFESICSCNKSSSQQETLYCKFKPQIIVPVYFFNILLLNLGWFSKFRAHIFDQSCTMDTWAVFNRRVVIDNAANSTFFIVVTSFTRNAYHYIWYHRCQIILRHSKNKIVITQQKYVLY